MSQGHMEALHKPRKPLSGTLASMPLDMSGIDTCLTVEVGDFCEVAMSMASTLRLPVTHL